MRTIYIYIYIYIYIEREREREREREILLLEGSAYMTTRRIPVNMYVKPFTPNKRRRTRRNDGEK